MVRQINWVAVLPQTALMFALMIGLEYGLKLQGGALFGAMLYFGLFYLLQMLVPHHHRRGLWHIRRREYEPAIESFRHSFEFFDRRVWLDQYRAVILLSASKMSYREMALLNLAYCLVQLERYEEAKTEYEAILRLFPSCEMAKNALDYFNQEPESREEEQEEEEFQQPD